MVYCLYLCRLKTVTEKHKLNVPETMTEVLDVSDEEGESCWISLWYANHGVWSTVPQKCDNTLIWRYGESQICTPKAWKYTDEDVLSDGTWKEVIQHAVTAWSGMEAPVKQQEKCLYFSHNSNIFENKR